MKCFAFDRSISFVDASFAFARKLGSKGIFGLTFAGMWLCQFSAEAEMRPSTIYSSTNAIAAIVSGDFDSTHPGSEIACLRGDGSVIELALEESGWKANTMFVFPGEPAPWENPAMRAGLRIGDVLPANPGPEIVLYFQGLIAAVYRTPSGDWTNQIIADLRNTLGNFWAGAVGDCDPSHPGDEVFSVFEGILDFSTGTVYSETNGTWGDNQIYSAEVGMDSVIGDTNPEHAGNEIIVVTEMGPAYEIQPPANGGPGPWPMRTIWDDPANAGWVARIGDVDPETPGNEIVYGTRYSNRIMMSRYNGTNMHNVEILFTGITTNHPDNLDNMLDVAIGHLSPGSPTAEILGVDASGSVYLVQRAINGWQGSIAWRDTNALYAVAASDLTPSPGDEVIVGGASGVVTLLSNPAPVLQLSLPYGAQAILTWNGLPGLTYDVEATANLASGSSWKQLTNLVYQGGPPGVMSYTNSSRDTAANQFFRIRVD